jgi:hypothetical protein
LQPLFVLLFQLLIWISHWFPLGHEQEFIDLDATGVAPFLARIP